MATSVQADAIARILERREDSATRYVDLELVIQRSDGSHLLGVGGRWDRVERRYVGPAETGAVVRLMPSQDASGEDMAVWLRRWLSGDWADYDRPYTWLWRGGRRAGKSHLAIVLALAVAVARPDSILWGCAAKDAELQELRDAIASVIPDGWSRDHRADQEYALANGSRLRMLSAYRADNLKQGRADFVILNEAQKCSRKAWIQARGAVADAGGLVLLTANPPDSTTGMWVQRLEERADAGRAGSVRCRFFDSRENLAIDRGALEALKAELGEVDAKTYRREVLGEYVPLDDIVLASFSREWNVREAPDDWTDVTSEFVRAWCGLVADTVVGCDFDLRPGCQGAVLRLYASPDGSEVVAWQIAEVANASGEDDLAEALITLPALDLPGAPDRPMLLDPARTLLVCDASGRAGNQAGQHVRGASSWGFLTARGFRPRPPDEPSKRNPPTSARYSLHDMLCQSTERRRRFAIRPECEWSIESHAEYPIVKGRPKRDDEHAHHVDATGYALWYLFGRRVEAKDWRPGDRVSSAPRRPTAKGSSSRGFASSRRERLGAARSWGSRKRGPKW